MGRSRHVARAVAKHRSKGSWHNRDPYLGRNEPRRPGHEGPGGGGLFDSDQATAALEQEPMMMTRTVLQRTLESLAYLPPCPPWMRDHVPCNYERHRPSDWKPASGGPMVCGICHPPARKELVA